MKSVARKSTARREAQSQRPVLLLLDLLGRKMTLRILWELSQAKNPLTFRSLIASAETNPSVLNARLKELRQAQLVQLDEAGYVLTARGLKLVALLLPLNAWAKTWAADLPNHAG